MTPGDPPGFGLRLVTQGGVTGGPLQLSHEPPKRPESPLMAQYKDLRKTAVVDRHEAQASRAQSRRGEQRAIAVNRVRGDSIREAAQEAQSKESSKEPENESPETVTLDDTPTMITSQDMKGSPAAPGPEAGTGAKSLEDPSWMDLD